MSKNKAKQKFSPLFISGGSSKTSVQLPGRHSCQCLSARHQLVGNCIQCGRIVCSQEGSGPCFTCEALVCTKEEKEILLKGDKKSEELRNKLMGFSVDAVHSTKSKGLKAIADELLPSRSIKYQEGFQKALNHKDQLLEYDKTCEKRTRVIDDDSDYFSIDSNQWLTKQQRTVLQNHLDELKSKKYSSRTNQKIIFDFAGRQILEDKDITEIYNVNDQVFQKVLNSVPSDEYSLPATISRVQYIPENNLMNENADLHKFRHTIQSPSENRIKLRLQDRELQQISDDGWCLSVHQPYASFITMGIKKHEGRVWYTAHRGRLWIAAAAKQPSVQEVAAAENAIKIIHGNCIFPEQYSTSCLLGCVDLADCLSQEQYIEQYPDGESCSPYVFICENAQELLVKFPIQGKHKLYKLDERVHQAAVKMLLKKRVNPVGASHED